MLSVGHLCALPGPSYNPLFFKTVFYLFSKMKGLRVRGQVCLRSPTLDCKSLVCLLLSWEFPLTQYAAQEFCLHTGNLQGVGDNGAFQTIVSQQAGCLTPLDLSFPAPVEDRQAPRYLGLRKARSQISAQVGVSSCSVSPQGGGGKSSYHSSSLGPLSPKPEEIAVSPYRRL